MQALGGLPGGGRTLRLRGERCRWRRGGGEGPRPRNQEAGELERVRRRKVRWGEMGEM